MKIAKITGWTAAGLLAALCLYFWGSTAYAKLSGSPVSLFGYELRLTGDTGVSETLPGRALLFLQPLNGDVREEDVVTFSISKDGTDAFVGQVIDVPDNENALIRYNSTSPSVLVPQSLLHSKAIYESVILGQLAFFSASPMGIALLVALPIALLLFWRLWFLLRRKKKDELPADFVLSVNPEPEAPQEEQAQKEQPDQNDSTLS